MLANARMPVKFDRIFINDSLQVTAGRIDMLTRGVQAMAEEQLAAQKNRQQKQGDTEEQINGGQPQLPDIIIPIAGTIEEIYLNDQQQIVVVDAEGNEQVLELEKDPETGDYVPVQVVDDAGNTYVVDSDGKVEKVEGNQGAVADVNNQPKLQNQLIIEVVASLQESLENYLLNHGKGPLSDQELWQLQNLPEYVPQDPEMVQGITDYLPKIKNNTDAFWEGFSDQSKNQLLY
ncbi:MAG: hypothetical protein ACOCWM_05035 [Cyclobacteriaceae bacterium]